MRAVDAANAQDYLREKGLIASAARVCARPLTGGVSNEVVLLECIADEGQSATIAGERSAVLKQARAQLRTPDPWFCGVERVWREVAVLRLCQRLARPGQTPRILFEDRENYLFIMTAAPAEHRVWRDELLAGRADPTVAAASGALLAALHAATWEDAEVASAFADREIFRQLRLDPYYAATARACPEAQDDFEALTASVWNHRRSLVQGDFSPKNLLVWGAGIMLVDYEVGHFGDPAFDLGFFLSHLVLKAFYHAPRPESFLALATRFWQAYGEVLGKRISPAEYEALVARAIQNLAGCAWARLDGTSRIDYLTDERRRQSVRATCRELFRLRPTSWNQALEIVRARLSAN